MIEARSGTVAPQVVTTVAEMTPEDLKTLILETVEAAMAETMWGPDWLAEWRELVAHQRHLASLYAEFAEEAGPEPWPEHGRRVVEELVPSIVEGPSRTVLAGWVGVLAAPLLEIEGTGSD